MKHFFICLKYSLFSIIILFLINTDLFGEQRVSRIFFERKNVFDSTQKDWFFAAPLINSLHVVTRKYIIEDELLFKEGDDLDEKLLAETERNLRATGFFTDIHIDLDSINEWLYDVYVVTHDKWSTTPSILFGTGGNTTNWGGKLDEDNFIGLGTGITLEALHRSENSIGWQGSAEVIQPRLFRSELYFNGSILAHRYRTEQTLSLYKPFRTLDTKVSYGFEGSNFFGSDFLYESFNNKQLMNFHERRAKAWLSRAWRRTDRVFATVLMEFEDIHRIKPEYKQAYDNSGKILIAFSSVAEDYTTTSKLNYFLTEDLPIGGWGTAILGKAFPVGSRGDNLYYVAGQGERSAMYGNLYLFGQITGASGFARSRGKYTYQEFFGLGFYRFSNSCLLAARIRQQTVWNWDAQRQLILDNDGGLRGYKANNLTGDNRIVANLELRLFPDFDLWVFKLGGTAFYDVGTAWKQNIDLDKTRWHNSLGAGLRIQFMKSTGPNSLFRIDFAYNFDEKRLGGIIFTTDQLFSIFKPHQFNLPEFYGLEFDYE